MRILSDRMRHWLFFCALTLAPAASVLVGCGESWQAATYPASGRVSINGKAPVGALVQLIPTGQKVDPRNSRPWGLVGEDGTFTLATYAGETGAPAGDYAFTITWPPDASRPSMVDRLKSKYTRPDQSKWKMTIKEGNNVLPPVEMTNVDVDMKVDSGPPAPLAGPMQSVPAKKTAKGRR